MATRVLALSLVVAPLAAQPSGPQDLTIDFASAIAERLSGAGVVTLTAAEPGLDEVQRGISRVLAARGIRVVDRADAATAVRFACFENLRERGCAAEIRNGNARNEVAVTRPLEATAALLVPPLSLDAESIVSQRTPILDIATAGDRLYVLDPDHVTLYRRAETGWTRFASHAIERPPASPRDVRGRLSIDSGGEVLALLAGIGCRSNEDLTAVACAQNPQPWPLGIPNAGLDGRRNHFSTPEGFPFFNAASLDNGAGARWIAAATNGGLVFLDDNRRVIGAVPSGDDVVALKAPCGGESLVLVSSPRPDRSDAVRLFRVSERELIPRAAPIDWRGQLTALWSDSSGTTATAVVRTESGQRYDAFQIRIVCDR